MGSGLGKIEDVLVKDRIPGIYSVLPSDKNNPTSTYGILIFTRSESTNWSYAILIPTSLSAMYINFYNGYVDQEWLGWKHVNFIDS